MAKVIGRKLEDSINSSNKQQQTHSSTLIHNQSSNNHETYAI